MGLPGGVFFLIIIWASFSGSRPVLLRVKDKSYGVDSLYSRRSLCFLLVKRDTRISLGRLLVVGYSIVGFSFTPFVVVCCVEGITY